MRPNKSPLTTEAIAYTWRQLAQRAGVVPSKSAANGFEELGIPVFYGPPEQAQFRSPGLIICRCDESAWEAVLNASENSLSWIPAKETVPPRMLLPFNNPIPVLFWGNGCEGRDQPFAAPREDGSIVFYADILAASFFMLSRWEETVLPARDEHERFPGTAGAAYRQGFLDLPIVDQYGLILRAWLRTLLPGWEPASRSFSVKLSHDIDHVCTFNSIRELLTKAGGDIVNRKNPRKAVGTITNGINEWREPWTRNQQFQGIIELAEISRRNGLESAFYFKASGRSRYDSGYHPEWKWVQKVIRQLKEQGFDVGFHPGYMTFNNVEALKKEKSRFDRVVGSITYGGRQHYLRFKVPDTWRHWEQAGFTYDSSMIFPDKIGFRCGTCHPFSPFDLTLDRQLNILEIPLMVMENILEKEGLNLQEGHDQIMGLAKKCLEVEGIFTLLWHNTSLHGQWQAWYEEYKKIVPKLAAMKKGDIPSA